MANSNVISDVGSSIVSILRKNLVPEPITKLDKIDLCSPNDKGDVQVSVYLYNIEENAEFRPNNMIPIADNKLRYPPMSLTLYYMITAHSSTEIKQRSYDEHLIMGKVMQVLNDNRVIRMDDLKGTLKDQNEGFEIQYNNLAHEEKLRVWSFPNFPYKLSQFYKVSPILLESNKFKDIKRVSDASITVNVIDK